MYVYLANPQRGCAEERAAGGNALNGRWLAVTKKQFVFKLAYLPSVTKWGNAPACELSGLGTLAHIHLELTQADEAEDRYVCPRGSLKQRWWYASPPIRVRLRNPLVGDTLVIQTRSPQGTWAEATATRAPAFAHSLLIDKTGNGKVCARSICSRLTDIGWYVPKDKKGEDADGLCPTVMRSSAHRLGIVSGFCMHSRLEKEKGGRTHLACYMGANPSSGSLVSLGFRQNYLHHEFDGLHIHVLPTLPVDFVEDFRIGAIVGSSGNGKTVLAVEQFGHPPVVKWADDARVRDHLPERSLGAELLRIVGLSSESAACQIGSLSASD